MNNPIWTAALLGTPHTKKNSQRILAGRYGGRYIAPSKKYTEYEQACLYQIRRPRRAIDQPVNIRCLYYMPDRRRVDLLNLLEATDDILVKAGVLADDRSSIVVGHDGSRVLLDRQRPRVEITITEARAISGQAAAAWIPVGEKPEGNCFACPHCGREICIPAGYWYPAECGIVFCQFCGERMADKP